jgi:hypothetical protein
MEQSEALNGTALDMEPEGELLPEQDEVSRAAVVDTKGSWICEECATENNPNTVAEENRDVCFECGATKPADQVEEAVAEEAAPVTSKPADVPLPLDEAGDTGDGFERFNANKAFGAIADKNVEVQASRDKYEALKKQTAEAKKELDNDEAALGRIITGFAKARAVQNSPQAMLPLNGQAPAVESNCPWERANPGFPCPVCTAAKKAKLNPSSDSEVHPEHDKHEDTATAAFDANVITPLIPKLKAKGLAITPDEIMDLEADQLQSLIDWTEQNGIVPPPILATSHVAMGPGTMAQVCKHCSIDLAYSTDPEGFYAEGERVGLDCDAKLNEIVERVESEVAEEEAAAETAVRKPRSHAKKATSKKREPEQERAQQVAAGKAKTAKEPKKAKAAKKGSK